MLVFPTQLLALASALPVALACLGYEGGVPVATASHSNSAPITVKSGQVYDCGWARYDRGSGACGDGEGGDSDAVFLVQAGGTLRNCIIGKNQMEGVHCLGACNLEFICELFLQLLSNTSGPRNGQNRGHGTLDICGMATGSNKMLINFLQGLRMCVKMLSQSYDTFPRNSHMAEGRRVANQFDRKEIRLARNPGSSAVAHTKRATRLFSTTAAVP